LLTSQLVSGKPKSNQSVVRAETQKKRGGDRPVQGNHKTD